MNSQTAITLLKDLEQSLDDYCELNDEGKTAFSMAITALELFGISEQLPSVQPDKDLLHLQREQAYLQGYEDGKKPRRGKWRIDNPHSEIYRYACSECHAHHRARYDFCPSCGADMRGEQDDS